MENQPNFSESKKEDQPCREFQGIKKANYNIWITGKCGLGIWAPLRMYNINLSSELLINIVDRLTNFWTPLKEISNKRKKTLNKPRMTKVSANP